MPVQPVPHVSPRGFRFISLSMATTGHNLQEPQGSTTDEAVPSDQVNLVVDEEVIHEYCSTGLTQVELI